MVPNSDLNSGFMILAATIGATTALAARSRTRTSRAVLLDAQCEFAFHRDLTRESRRRRRIETRGSVLSPLNCRTARHLAFHPDFRNSFPQLIINCK
jgi:hypothetical protein